jgi:biotin-dependent carboxylase-like uncharacterized protein
VLEIRASGGLTTVQDLGRPGFAHLGVGRCGAADRGALRQANALVGNPASAAGLEITLGGLIFTARDAATVALAGAPAAGSLDWGVAVTLPAGTTVTLGFPATGLRSYLAVRGGVAAEPVLGSRSTDLLGGIGPAALKAGDRVAIGTDVAGDVSGTMLAPIPVGGALRIVFGPRDDWFSTASLARLTTARWLVRPESNRIGVRLGGPRLERTRPDELATESTLPGALQVPPDGQPILLGPDAPVTGGYPVIAVVVDDDLDAAGQLRPGEEVSFRAVAAE